MQKKSYTLEDMREEGRQQMIVRRVKSYAEGREIARQYLVNNFSGRPN